MTVNKNVEWLSAPGAWTFIVALVLLTWLLLSLVMDTGLAWTYTHLIHGAITYYLLHWNKGSPVQMDQVWFALLHHSAALLHQLGHEDKLASSADLQDACKSEALHSSSHESSADAWGLLRLCNCISRGLSALSMRCAGRV